MTKATFEAFAKAYVLLLNAGWDEDTESEAEPLVSESLRVRPRGSAIASKHVSEPATLMSTEGATRTSGQSEESGR